MSRQTCTLTVDTVRGTHTLAGIAPATVAARINAILLDRTGATWFERDDAVAHIDVIHIHVDLT